MDPADTSDATPGAAFVVPGTAAELQALAAAVEPAFEEDDSDGEAGAGAGAGAGTGTGTGGGHAGVDASGDERKVNGQGYAHGPEEGSDSGGSGDDDSDSSDDGGSAAAELRRRATMKVRRAAIHIVPWLSMRDVVHASQASTGWRQAWNTNRAWRFLFRRDRGWPVSRRLVRDDGVNWAWEYQKQARAQRELASLPFYVALGAHEDESARHIYWELKRRAAAAGRAEQAQKNVEYRIKRQKREHGAWFGCTGLG